MLILLYSVLFTCLFIHSTFGCMSHFDKREPSTGYPDFTIGTDGPADGATLGFAIGHVALLVNNLTLTRQFYGTILGMRHIFTFNATEEFAFMYMGHAQGGKNGTGFQTGAEMLSEIYNMDGLIEFISYRNASTPANERQYSTGPTRSFSHLGLVVPNITAAQARFDSFNVTILKRAGAIPNEDGQVPLVYGLPGPGNETEAALAGLDGIGFQGYMIIADPDGNVIEVISG